MFLLVTMVMVPLSHCASVFFPIAIFLVFFFITMLLVFFFIVVLLFFFWLSWFYVSLSCRGALAFLDDCGLGVPFHHHGLGLVFFIIVMVLVCFLIVMILCSSRLMWSCVLLSCYGLVF